MSKQTLIKDFKVTGGYLLTSPHENWIEHLEDSLDSHDDTWRYKAERLQKRRWRKILKNSYNLR